MQPVRNENYDLHVDARERPSRPDIVAKQATKETKHERQTTKLQSHDVPLTVLPARDPAPIQTGLTSGGQSAVEPPGPIPNPEVKRCSADGSGTIGPVRVGRRQVYARLQAIGVGLFCFY